MMKKTSLLIILLAVFLFTKAQNHFPDSGDVGIGTPTPTATLDVRGNVKLENSLRISGTDARFIFGDLGGAQVGTSNNGYSLDLHCRGNGGSIRFLKGDDKVAEIIAPNMTPNPEGEFKFSNGGKITNLDYVKTTAHHKLTLDVDGNSGGALIRAYRDGGVNMPILTLQDMVASGDYTFETFALFKANQITFEPDLVVNGAVYADAFYKNDGTPIGGSGESLWSSQGASVINYSGKVIVGTDSYSPDENTEFNLFVDNGIITEKVKVSAAGQWPDYVFEEGYDLPEISELEKHIKEHKHLPNVPSAEEIEEEGIDMAEMDARLLEKIEELTLYLIEQDKKMKLLEEEISALKATK